MNNTAIVAKIEELFSDLDKGVESLKAARAQLKVYRQAVLKHAFEGKLTVQWREENKDKLEKPAQLLARIEQDRRAQYERQLQEWKAAVQTREESGKLGKKPPEPKKPLIMNGVPDDVIAKLPKLPEGWLWVRLGDISDISGGLTKNQKRNSLPRKMKYLRVANVYADKILSDDVYKIGVTEGEAKKVALEVGDLLIVEGNGSIEQIGRVSVWEGELPVCGHQNHLIRARLATKFVPRFFLQFLLSPLGRDLIVKEASSTSGLHTLSISKVSNLIVPVASSAEESVVVVQIEEKLERIDRALEEVDAQLAKSEALHQSILKKAFTGQLVPQDPNDEPASALLGRIKAEKTAHSDKTITPRKTQTRQSNSMTGTLPINIDHLLRQRTIEGERIEYKAGWNPKSVLHTICAFANDFHNLGGGYVVLGVEEKNGRPLLPPKGIERRAYRRCAEGIAESGAFRDTAVLSSTDSDLRTLKEGQSCRPVCARWGNPPVQSQSQS